MTDPKSSVPTATVADESTDELLVEDLVEEVSIDGMCGVY